MKEIKGNCTPAMSITVDFDPNPNGLPVLWIGIRGSHTHKILGIAPLNKKAVGELLVELANRIGDM